MTANSLDTGLAALAKAFTTTGAIQDVGTLLAALADKESGDDHLKSSAAFLYAVWLQIDSAHSKDALRQSSALDTSTIRAAAQQAAGTLVDSRNLRTSLDYLLLWAEVRQYLKDHEFRRLRYSELLSDTRHRAALESRLRDSRSNLSTDYGFFMLQGMLTSLFDREEAARLFRRAEAENPAFITSQAIDRFVPTYLSDSDITAEAGSIADRRTRLMESFELLEGHLPKDKADTLLLFSCDPAFFAVFFPYWASTAMYLREQNVHLHFGLVGGHDEVSATVERGLSLAADTARLRGFSPSSASDNLSFSRVAALGDVAELRTLYASARFLIARELIKNSASRILILDVDMEIESDPRDPLRGATEIDPIRLPVVVASGLLTLVPAYRLPACKVLLPRDDIGQSILLDVENYTYAALPRANSWLLDQNALDYASGRLTDRHGPDILIDASHYVGPFRQRSIGRMYKHYMAQAKQHAASSSP